MLISVELLRQFVMTDETDQALEFRIQALESFIVNYTKNEFINRETGLVDYPSDVQLGAINLINWDLTGRDKIGISSETISRHSVSYGGSSAADTEAGYPVALIAFLKPYMKARF